MADNASNAAPDEDPLPPLTDFNMEMSPSTMSSLFGHTLSNGDPSNCSAEAGFSRDVAIDLTGKMPGPSDGEAAPRQTHDLGAASSADHTVESIEQPQRTDSVMLPPPLKPSEPNLGNSLLRKVHPSQTAAAQSNASQQQGGDGSGNTHVGTSDTAINSPSTSGPNLGGSNPSNARPFVKERLVLRWKQVIGKLTTEEEQELRDLEAAHAERSPSAQPDDNAVNPSEDRAAVAFQKVRALFNRKKAADELRLEEEIDFLKMEATQTARNRLQTEAAVRLRSASPANPSEGLFVSDTSGGSPPRQTRQRKRARRSPPQEASPPREPCPSRPSTRKPPRSAPSPPPAAQPEGSRRVRDELNPFTWRTEDNHATGIFTRAQADDRQEFTDDEINGLIQRARLQNDQARGRRGRLTFPDGYAPQISFGDYFIEAVKNEDRHGVPEAYLESMSEYLVQMVRSEHELPAYNGVPLKTRINRLYRTWKLPRRRDEEGKLRVEKDGVDVEFDCKKSTLYAKMRSATLTVEEACRFVLLIDVQRGRLQRRFLSEKGTPRSLPIKADAADNAHPLRLPDSSSFDEAYKPNVAYLASEAGQLLAEALFHVGAHAHRILDTFGHGDEALSELPVERDWTMGAMGE